MSSSLPIMVSCMSAAWREFRSLRDQSCHPSPSSLDIRTSLSSLAQSLSSFLLSHPPAGLLALSRGEGSLYETRSSSRLGDGGANLASIRTSPLRSTLISSTSCFRSRQVTSSRSLSSDSFLIFSCSCETSSCLLARSLSNLARSFLIFSNSFCSSLHSCPLMASLAHARSDSATDAFSLKICSLSSPIMVAASLSSSLDPPLLCLSSPSSLFTSLFTSLSSPLPLFLERVDRRSAVFPFTASCSACFDLLIS
mmetsp:Transcript_45039/g.141798  ORF Transcript_45039/g.141798 Transcript_45039/m.141798 type:complete len:253 (+) Transcript_45039:180-938(+)